MSFYLSLSLESQNQGVTDEDIDNAMDAEDTVTLQQEKSIAEQEIRDDMEQIGELEVAAESLTSLAAIVASGTEAHNQREVMTIAVATEAIFAKMGNHDMGWIDSDDPKVSIESKSGTNVSLEFKDKVFETASRIWEKMKALLASVWKKIRGLWRKHTDQGKSVMKAAKKLASRADDTSGKTIDKGKVDVKAQAVALSVGGKFLVSASELISALDTLKDECTYWYTKYNDQLIKAGKELESSLSKFKIKSADDSLKVVNTAAAKATDGLDKRLKKSVANDKRFAPTSKVTKSDDLLGNRAVFLSVMNPSKGNDSSTTGVALANRMATLDLRMYKSGDLPKPKTTEIKTYTAGECTRISELAMELAGMITDFNTSSDGIERFDSTREKLSSASKKVKDDMKGDEVSATDLRYFTAAVNYVAAYNRWSTTLYSQLASLVVTSCNAAIKAGNASLSDYKTV